MKPDAAAAPWWGDGLRFSCTGCGSCCGGAPGAVWFTGDELHAMAAALGLSPEQFSRDYVWRKYGPPSLRERANYDCVMLDGETKRCRIYDARPSQCRTFPFWPDAVESRENWDRYASGCPGMNCGELHTREEIERRLAEQERE